MRVDALAPGSTPPDVATAHRASVQMRLQTLEGGSKVKAASSAMGKSTPSIAAPSATHKAAASASYNASGDVVDTEVDAYDDAVADAADDRDPDALIPPPDDADGAARCHRQH